VFKHIITELFRQYKIEDVYFVVLWSSTKEVVVDRKAGAAEMPKPIVRA
jgi:hypothetical protein